MKIFLTQTNFNLLLIIFNAILFNLWNSYIFQQLQIFLFQRNLCRWSRMNTNVDQIPSIRGAFDSSNSVFLCAQMTQMSETVFGSGFQTVQIFLWRVQFVAVWKFFRINSPNAVKLPFVVFSWTSLIKICRNPSDHDESRQAKNRWR